MTIEIEISSAPGVTPSVAQATRVKASEEGLLDRKTRMTPAEYAKMLRAHGPVCFWETNDIWVVTDYHLAREVLKSPDFSADRSSFFISRMPEMDLSLIRDFFGVVGRMMVMSDAPEHTARRKTASHGLSDALVDHYRAVIDETVEKLISQAEKKGYLEFVNDLAQPLPSAVLADLFMIPEEDRQDFYRWSNNMTEFFGGASQYRNEDGIRVNQSAINLRDYFTGMMEDRRRSPQDDFLGLMVQCQARHGIQDEEVVAQAVMMLVAGSVTTTDQLCNNMYTFMTEPGVWARLGREPELLPTAIEEMNRLDPGVSYLFRVVKRDTRVGSHAFKAGETVFISNHAVNRDPAVFSNPEECDPGRNPNPHFSFGNGAHYCIGARLARIQMTSLFGALLKKYPKLQIDPVRGVERRHYSLAFSGFESLHLNS